MNFDKFTLNNSEEDHSCRNERIFIKFYSIFFHQSSLCLNDFLSKLEESNFVMLCKGIYKKQTEKSGLQQINSYFGKLI